MQLARPIGGEVILFTGKQIRSIVKRCAWSPYSIAISPPRSLFDESGRKPIANGISIAIHEVADI